MVEGVEQDNFGIEEQKPPPPYEKANPVVEPPQYGKFSSSIRYLI
jgi:hypothetical protein